MAFVVAVALALLPAVSEAFTNASAPHGLPVKVYSAGGSLLGDAVWDVLFPFPASARVPLSNELGAYGTTPFFEWNMCRTNSSAPKSCTYPSDIADGGDIRWQSAHADSGHVHVNVSNVRYDFLQEALGLGVTAYVTGWAFTEFFLDANGTYLAWCGAANRFQIDNGPLLQGDYYAWYPAWGDNSWVKWPVTLSAGRHVLAVQLRQETFACSLELMPEERPPIQVMAPDQDVLWCCPTFYVPSVGDGHMVSPFIGLPIVNTSPVRLSIARASMKPGMQVSLVAPAMLEPGQGIPVGLKISQGDELLHCDDRGKVTLTVTLFVEADASFWQPKADAALLHHHSMLNVTVDLPCWAGEASGEAVQFTFLDVDKSVQLAAAKPPVDSGKPGNCPKRGCPVVLATHGAGVNAVSAAWTGAFPPFSNAWVLLPTNRAAFGYDWQGLGLVNALTALRALAKLQPGVPEARKAAAAVDEDTLLFTGHSMGGHGCLVLVTHLADRAVGAACAAGWIRFDHYMQEYSSMDTSFVDTTLLSILQSSVAPFRTDEAAPNIKGVPVLARMGADDDNVNPWNLRRFARIVDQVNGHLGWATVSEVEGQGHWFDGVMNGQPMADFYARVLRDGKAAMPRKWRVKSSGGWNEGRGGCRILQPATPFTAAWIDVSVSALAGGGGGGAEWALRTHNVRRFSLCEVAGLRFQSVPDARPARLVVNGMTLKPLHWRPCRAALLDLSRPDAVTQRDAPAPKRGLQRWPRRRLLAGPTPPSSAPTPTLSEVDSSRGEGDEGHDHFVLDEGTGLLGSGAFVSSGDSTWRHRERSWATSGPLAQILEGPLVLVCGTRGGANMTAAMHDWAVLIANAMFTRGRVAVRIVADSELLFNTTLQGTLAGSNFVLAGGPHSNAVSAALLSRSTFPRAHMCFGHCATSSQAASLPSDSRRNASAVRDSGLHVGGGSEPGSVEGGSDKRCGRAFQDVDGSSGLGSRQRCFSIGDWLFAEPGCGVIALGHLPCLSSPGMPPKDFKSQTPKPALEALQSSCGVGKGGEGGSLLALVEGNDREGFLRAARLFPSEPNAQVPDWAVVGPELDWQGAGGIRAAGFFDHRWRVLPGMSYPRT